MSISVTVNGNPVNIQKGRMVTASPNRSKKDFEKRRLIRLSQVRQQAKSIAEDVRNRVRQEQLKQSEELATEGKQKLKQWQSRKLLELQNQYHDALGVMGAGHKEAVLLEDEEVLIKKKEQNDKIAKQRGFSAGKILLEEKAKRFLSTPSKKNKSPRKIVSRKHIKESVKRSTSRQKNDDKFSTVTEVSGVVTESDYEYEDNPEISANPTSNFKGRLDSTSFDNAPQRISVEGSLGNTNLEETERPTVKDTDEHPQINEQKNTRITDRIRQRSNQRLDQSDVCDTFSSVSQEITQGANPNQPPNIKGTQHKFPTTDQNIYTCACRGSMAITTKCHCIDSASELQESIFNRSNSEHLQRRQKSTPKSHSIPTKKSTICQPNTRTRSIAAEIPVKPKITLKSAKNSSLNPTSSKESNTTRPLATHVEKINDENLITSLEHGLEIDFLEKVRQRDEEAILRGQKALERERLQREYDELIKKLPALQKLERMYRMNQDRPEYHMTEDRLQEQEKKKQGILDNTYERLFPERRSPTITIPVKKISKDDKERIQPSESADLNLISWETERKSKKLYTEDEVENILREGKVPSESKFRTDQLKSVLEKLRRRKDELLREIPNFHEDTEKFSSVSFLPQSKDSVNNKNDSNTTTKDPPVKKKPETKVTKSRKVSIEKSKPDVPPKVNTEPNLKSSSSYETIEEPIQNLIKTTKHTKKAPKSVQMTQSKHKTKSSIRGGTATKGRVATKRKQEKDSSSEQSSSEPHILKKSLRTSPSGHPIKKKQKQVEIQSLSVPTNSLASVIEVDRMMCKMPNISCNCRQKSEHKNMKELCEIVIKIKDHKSSQISINDRNEMNNEDKSLMPQKPNKMEESNDKKRENESGHKRELKKTMKDDCCREKGDIVRFNSWHEKFSKNHSQISNTSTSYMSPPLLPNKHDEYTEAPPFFCELLGKKPQQHNLNELSLSPPTKLPAEKRDIFNDIKKLLKMSHLSIDDLGVSSVSTVTTPSQSLIDMESNKVSGSIMQPASMRSLRNYAGSNQETVCDGSLNSSRLFASSENKSITTNGVESSVQNYPDVLTKYAKIAEKCSQRISNLSAMIEKVREEKNRMLQNPSLLSNDLSTRYMELPSSNKRKNERVSRIDSKSSSSSSSDEVKGLLDIDMSLVEKLKGLSPEEIKNYGNGSTLVDENIADEADEYLEKRLKALRSNPVEHQTKPQQTPHKESSGSDSVEYVQFLLDIPRLPPLTSDLWNSKQKKPPPCKSFLAARKLSEDFPKPHELSTIPEQDSQTRFESTLKEKSQQPIRERKKQGKNICTASTENKNLSSFPETLEDMGELENVIMDADKKIRSSDGKKEETSMKNRPKRIGSMNMSDNSIGSSSVSGDEKVGLFRIEAMLRSIGMDWAISTLRKTQEALALTSSSSSLEMRSPNASKEFDDPEIRRFLSRKMLQKISSSTLKSDLSPGSLNGSHDLSEIGNVDFAMKQTSTPINMSNELRRSQEKTSEFPSVAESEKSARGFVSLPENSL